MPAENNTNDEYSSEGIALKEQLVKRRYRASNWLERFRWRREHNIKAR